MFSRFQRLAADHSFRRTPTEWNEAEFVFLDQVIAEAARNGLESADLPRRIGGATPAA